MDRQEATAIVLAAKARKGIAWAQAAQAVGKSKEWTTAGLLGQMTFTRGQAEALGGLFELPPEAVAALQTVPYKGRSPPRSPPIRSSTAFTSW